MFQARKKTIGFIIVSCVVLLFGCNNQHENVENISQNTLFERKEQIVASASELGLEAFHVERIEQPTGENIITCGRIRGAVGVALLLENNEEIIDYDLDSGFIQINLNTPQDQIIMSVFNACYTDRPFLVKVFYNYEEIPFRVADAELYYTELLLEIPSGYQVDIPINLSNELEKNDYLNILSIGAFPNPEHHAMIDDGFTINDMFGFMMSWAISYGGNEEIEFDVPFQNLPNQIEGIRVSGLRIQTHAEAWLEEHQAVYNIIDQLVRATPGEIIELYFYVNTHIETTEYLIVAMLDWQQIELNGQPFLRVEARQEEMADGFTDLGRFTITVPEEPGFYEFVAFIILNPTDIDNEIHHWEVTFDFPFTIEVAESFD